MRSDHAPFDLHELSACIDAARTDRGLAWADVSRQVGVATSTIRRYASASDAEADGVLALIRWVGVAPEEFVVDSAVVGTLLPTSGDGVIRVNMARVLELRAAPRRSRVVHRTTIQRLVATAQASGVPIAALTHERPT